MSSNDLDFGEYIEFSVKRRFGIITLNRVHRANAFTIDQLRNLKKVVKHCQSNDKIRGLIITANGSTFSTGIDIGSDYVDGGNHASVKDIYGTAADICQMLFYGKPSIAAVNGRCMGEGVVLTLCSDYRIAVRESYFFMPEIFSGIFPGTGCITLMVKQIGIPWTKKMLMFAERVDIDTALKIRLIDEIVESHEDLLKVSLEKAKSLFTKNQTVLNAIKICSNHIKDKSYTNAYEVEQLGSAWFEYEDKNKYLELLREKVG